MAKQLQIDTKSFGKGSILLKGAIHIYTFVNDGLCTATSVIEI